MKEAQVAKRRKAIACLKESIQGTGLGSLLINLGLNPRMMYGKAIPKPMQVNARISMGEDNPME